MARSKRVIQKYIDFSGGYQTFTSPLLLKVNESPFLYNVDISKPGILAKSLGYAQIGTGTGSGSNRGVYAWNRENGDDELYQVYGSDMYKYNGSSFVSIGSGFGTASGAVEFGVSFINTGTGVGTAAETFVERLYVTPVPGKYLQAVYGNNGSGTYYVKLLKTENSGETWEIGDTIYSGSTSYTEASVARIGDNKMIALIRTNSGGYVQQFTSADDGETWSSPSDTNLGPSTGVKIPHIIYDEKSNKVIAIYCSRTSPYSVKISEGDALEIYASATAWTTPITVSTMGIGAGYPSMLQITGNRCFYVFANQISSSDTDTYGGIYEFMQTNPNIRFRNTAPIQEIKCNVLLNENQSITSGDAVLVAFSKVVSDPSNSFNNSSGNYKFIAPVDGEYLVSGQLFWAGVATDTMARLLKNGTLEILSMFPSTRSVPFSKIIIMNQGDYLQLYCRHLNGSNLSLEGGLPHQTYMTIHLLSRKN